jgi:hypothetical protein
LPPLTSAVAPHHITLTFAVLLLRHACLTSHLPAHIAFVAPSSSLAMAELPEKGRHAKRHKPSRLRNEIRPESTNDKRDTQKHVVQVPHSDTIVLETQLDDNGRFDATDFDLGLTNKPDDGEVPLSPRSAAMLERNTATKKTQPPESTPLTIKLLSKIDFSKRVDSSSVPSFSFGRPTKASSKTSPNVEIATTQSIAGERSTREQRWNDTSNGMMSHALQEPKLTSSRQQYDCCARNILTARSPTSAIEECTGGNRCARCR